MARITEKTKFYLLCSSKLMKLPSFNHCIEGEVEYDTAQSSRSTFPLCPTVSDGSTEKRKSVNCGMTVAEKNNRMHY